MMEKTDGDSQLSQEILALLEAFRRRYPFVFDPFQAEAIRHIASGSSVIVSAPTGAGKTLIAEFAIFRALQQGQRIAYTTPIKALSNQKYADFCRQFGDTRVGILTGDVQVNPQASVLVMTTEILRNMFYLAPPENLGCVVLDECHYMGDAGRGTVWEEIIINCPKEVPLVALSATVSNVGEIAAWITEVHRPIIAIQHPVRPVPLQYCLTDPAGKIVSVSDLTIQERAAFAAHRPGRHSRRRRGPDLTRLILQLQARRWLPAIYFIFSRSGCEAALRRLLGAGVELIDPHRQPEVEEAIERTLLDYPSIAAESALNSLILEGLRRGVGLHHAGILAALKRLTEVLFERGLVQVVFATETMSLGIHMPAKTVVIENLRKRSDDGFRTLLVGELTQMAGRAGRRGIDPQGTCLVAVESREVLEEALRLIKGKPEPIESRFRIGYSSAALLIQSLPDPQAIRKTIERSFGQFQNRRRIRALEVGRQKLLRRLQKVQGSRSPCCAFNDFIAYEEQKALVAAEQQRLHMTRPRQERTKREPPSTWDDLLQEDGRHVHAQAQALSRSPCHRCPGRPQREERLARSKHLRQQLQQRLRLREHLQDSYWDQFLRVARVLEHFGYLKAGVLSPEGRLVAALRHDNELLVARVLFSGILDSLKAAELAAVLSCLSEEPREAEPRHAWLFLTQNPHLQKRLKAMGHLAQELLRVQQSYQVNLPVSVHVGYLAASYRWASGEEDWTRLVQESYGGHEGDLIRALRRLIDLCRQLAESPEAESHIRERLWQAVSFLDRGIVLESALI
jgi:ATP-dependent RNA helicase HelY